MKEKLSWALFLASMIGGYALSLLLAEKMHIGVEWQRYGYGGVFLSALFANAAVFVSIPIPTLPFALEMAEQINPFFLGVFYAAVIYAVGASFGESTGYIIGFLTGGVLGKMIRRIFNNKYFKTAGRISGLERISTAVQGGGEAFYGAVEGKIGFKKRIPIWLEKYGGLAIMGLAFFPSPFDFLGVLLGSMRYPWWKFWLFTFLGRVPKYIIAIYLLYYGVEIVFH